MSVILGYKAEDKLYLAADNRTSTIDDVPIRDDVNKIVVVNNNVAVAFAGYGGTQTVFEGMIKNISKDFKVEDVLFLLKILYWICKIPWYKKYTKNIMDLGSRFIVAGKNKKDECCMYTVSYINGKFEKPSLTDRFLFPPYDVSPKVCWDFYVKNVISSNSDFIQKTIKDIAKVSNLVSSSGDIWTYNFVTSNSSMEHFS